MSKGASSASAVPQFCVALSPLLFACFAIVEAAHAEPAHTHTHSLSLSLSLPFLSPFCSGRATNNRSPLYLSLHHTISDRRALVLTAISPSYSPNLRVDHSSIVHWAQAESAYLGRASHNSCLKDRDVEDRKRGSSTIYKQMNHF